MKKAIFAITLAITSFIGCNSIPSADSMYTISKSVGVAAGYTIELLKIEECDKAKFIEIIDNVKKVVPSGEDTYETAWNKFAAVEVKKFEGKINTLTSELIVTGVTTAGKAVDFVINKYPNIKENAEVIQASVKGVIDGIEVVIKSQVAGASAKNLVPVDINYEAYFVLSRGRK